MNEYYFNCKLCDMTYHRSDIKKENGFVLFNNLRFICPNCKIELGRELK